MKANLKSLTLSNFKGIQSQHIDFGAKRTVIKAKNGVGKTTIYDAFLWLLFGKDCTGRKDSGKGGFGVRPVDSENNIIPGLIVRVDGVLEIDGTKQTFRRELHDKAPKTRCWIHGVTKNVGEYETYISTIVKEEIFKQLTDLRYFPRLHWQEQRKVLLGLTGDIPSPVGFEGLTETLAGRTLDDMKKVLADQKKALTDEQKGNEARIDEVSKNIGTATAEGSLALEREQILTSLGEYDEARTKLYEDETARQGRIDAVTKLKLKLGTREAELASDTSGVTGLIEQKNQAVKGLQEYKDKITDVQDRIAATTRGHDRMVADHVALQADRNNRVDVWNELDGQIKKIQTDTAVGTCSLCGQVLPTNMLQDLAGKKAKKIEKLNNDRDAVSVNGKAITKLIEDSNAGIAECQAGLRTLTEELNIATGTLQAGQETYDKAMPGLETAITQQSGTPTDRDGAWIDIKRTLDEAELAVGEPSATQLVSIEQDIRKAQDRMAAIDLALAGADEVAKSKSRVEKLAEREKEIGQQLADIAGILDQIAKYKAAESTSIEAAVNGMFKHIKFKLFNTLVNGDTEDTCEAVLGGTPYSDMSYGETILTGIDIINVLSKHHDQSVPLFIDNSESLTFQIETETQRVELFADPAQNTLKVERED